jgi:hypothetical protein
MSVFDDFSLDDWSLIREGSLLSETEREKIVDGLKPLTDERDNRLRLLGGPAGETRTQQISWFRRHEPGTCLGPYGLISSPKEASYYDEGKRLWTRALEARAADYRVSSNAALFFVYRDPELGIEVLDRSGGDAESSRRLCTYLAFAASQHPVHQRAFALRGVRAGSRAMELEPEIEKSLDLIARIRECGASAQEAEVVRLMLEAHRKADAWEQSDPAKRAELASSIRELVAVAGRGVS